MRLRILLLIFAGLWLGLGVSQAVTGQQQTAAAAEPAESSSESFPESSKVLVLNFDAAKTVVHWTLPSTFHTVHGTFRLKSGSLRIETSTGKITGEIIVDAASGESGSDGRDSKMHREILESSRYSEIKLLPDRFSGNIPLEGIATAQMHGTFSLHGVDHEVNFPVQAELSKDQWKGTCLFTVPYVKWGLKNPSTFLLKVNPDVQIEMQAAGTFQSVEE